MKTLATIICGLGMFILGLAIIRSGDMSPDTGYKSMAAATIPYVDLRNADIPRDLLLDAEKNVQKTPVVEVDFDSVKVDSLSRRTRELEELVTKTKRPKVPAPKVIVKTKVVNNHTRDTIQVPVYYLATQVGNKEGPTDKCISIYEVHKVDEVCPENTNSSEKRTIEYVNTEE